MAKIKIPVTDELGFFEIRFESIGGLGAHVGGQILAEAIVLKMDLNAAHFSSYGSEKKGTPIKSFVRICDKDQEIRTASPVETPHVIAVFHDALLKNPTVLAGLRQGGTLIINTVKSAEDLKPFIKDIEGKCNIYLLDALGIAVAEKSRVNTALMGAMVQVSGFIERDAVLEILAEKFQKKHPSAVEPNKRTFNRGAKELKLLSAAKAGADPFKLAVKPVRPTPVYGYETAPIGGLIIDPGNTILNDMSASRQGFLPAYHQEKCVNCGICDLVCPDHCFVWEDTTLPGLGTVRLKGIDYQYCKGCMRCVDSCPSGALTKEREEEGWAAKN
ncbi:MAG: 2-oxoacid:acceptor oxidoreductase family protein, partial [Elusimicrobia bacterium]|nr:2-oxoacid:acceptor oxidoreductase family protein [Elusimicrobiota bacterium]